MVLLYLGRHGETKLNSEEKLRSWIDEPLNAVGVNEAHEMADAMNDIALDRIFSSDLVRASHTARIVAAKHGLKAIPRQWFRPLDYGDLNGKKIADIQSELDRLNDIWQTNPEEPAPNGESFAEFQERNLQGLHAILTSANENETIMLVAHLRNCLLFHAVATTGGPLKGKDILKLAGKDWHQESGAVSKFRWEGDLLKFQGIFFEPSEPEAKEVNVS